MILIKKKVLGRRTRKYANGFVTTYIIVVCFFERQEYRYNLATRNIVRGGSGGGLGRNVINKISGGSAGKASYAGVTLLNSFRRQRFRANPAVLASLPDFQGGCDRAKPPPSPTIIHSIYRIIPDLALRR